MLINELECSKRQRQINNILCLEAEYVSSDILTTGMIQFFLAKLDASVLTQKHFPLPFIYSILCRYRKQLASINSDGMASIGISYIKI